MAYEDEDYPLGMIDIRLADNDRILNDVGHIGYSIRPTERGKGLNLVNLYLALRVCQEHGLSRVRLSCDKANLPSANSMKHFGAVLVHEYWDTERKIDHQIYEIDVDETLARADAEFADKVV